MLHRVFIIAEAGVNHNGDVNLAHRLVDWAAEAGADAVKFQTFKTELMVSPRAEKATYQKAHGTPEQMQQQMLQELELTVEDHRRLIQHCQENGIFFLSTPFHEEAVYLLDRLGVGLFKVGSGDLNNLPLLECVARKRKPIILSTGMATMGEIELAVNCIRKHQKKLVPGDFPDLTLLHCVSCYPTPFEEVNLRALKTLEERFHLPVGFSDHTLGIEVSLAAVALGACVIEKHLTLDRSLPGPDHAMSLEPKPFRELVEGIRRIEAALGDGIKRCQPCEAEIRELARKSIVAIRDIPAGALLTKENIGIRRPGTGLAPSRLSEVLNTRAVKFFKSGELIFL